MSISIGSIIAKIGADTSGLKRGMNDAQRITRQGAAGITKNIGGVTRSFTLLKTAMAAAVGGYFVKQVAGGFLEIASSFETMKVKLDAMTDSQGFETLEAINKWAIEMPVRTAQAVNAFTMMRAMGLDPTIKTMQTFTDVASVMGQDALPRIALALGQMRSMERISAQDLNQLAQVGINARRYIKEAFGTGYEQVRDAGVDILKVIDAIVEGMDREFGGSARRMMNTWQGVKTQFLSYLDEIRRQIMNFGIFDEIKRQVQGVSSEIWDWWEANKYLIELNTPVYIAKVRNAITALTNTLGRIKAVWDAIPSEAIAFITGYAFTKGLPLWARAAAGIGAIATQGMLTTKSFSELAEEIRKTQEQLDKLEKSNIGYGKEGVIKALSKHLEALKKQQEALVDPEPLKQKQLQLMSLKAQLEAMSGAKPWEGVEDLKKLRAEEAKAAAAAAKAEEDVAAAMKEADKYTKQFNKSLGELTRMEKTLLEPSKDFLDWAEALEEAEKEAEKFKQSINEISRLDIALKEAPQKLVDMEKERKELQDTFKWFKSSCRKS